MEISCSVVFLICITYTTAFQLSTSSTKPTAGTSFSIICTTDQTFLTFMKDNSLYCTINGDENGKCNLDPHCPQTNTYSCNNSIGIYTITLPGLVITDSLHGSKWRCASPFGIGTPSNEVQLYITIPVTQVAISTKPTDGNPIAIVMGTVQQFECTTDAGRPSSSIQWYLSGTNVTSSATSQPDVCNHGCNGTVVSSSILLYTGIRNDEGKNIYCTALNIESRSVRSQNRTLVILYSPNRVSISPSTQNYIVTETTGNIGPINCTADCKPDCTMTWSGPNISGSITSVLYLTNINRTQAGHYQCTASNTVGSMKSEAVTVVVNYGPIYINIYPSHQKYTITELTGNVGPINCTAGCKPLCTMTWNGPNMATVFTSVLNLQNISRNQAGNYQCIATNSVGSVKSVTVTVIVNYGPHQVNISPSVQNFTVTELIGTVGPTSCTADCKPDCTMTWSGPNLSGSTTSVLNLKNIDRTHAGKYQCTASNSVGSMKSVTVTVIVNYGPNQVNMYPSIQTYTVIEITEGIGPITCTAGCKPDCTIQWSGPNLPGGTSSVLSLTNITRNQAGNYQCTASNSVGSVKSVKVTVIVNYKPLLDYSRPYSPSLMNVKQHTNLQLTSTITANPTPTVYWTFNMFKAESTFNSCNLSTILSNTSTNGFRTSSFIMIDNVQRRNFGEYLMSANNTVGIFFRRFVVMDEVSYSEDMLAVKQGNGGMFSAGIASLVVGLLFFVAATIFIFRKRFKKTYTKSSKSDDYADLQASNSAFQDPYTSIHNPIESRHHQESSANTYEECGNTSDAAAYQNIENMNSGHKKEEQNLGIYDNMKI